MSRVVVIGGTGHVGTYLLLALVERAHDVINVSRGQAKRYRDHVAWNAIEQVVVDRTVEENVGTFSSTVAALRPDVVVDMISFRLSSTQSLVEALSGKVEHFLHCSTIWVFGHNAAVPAEEGDPLNPFGK